MSDLEHARREAERRRAAGGYAGVGSGGPLEQTFTDDPPGPEQLGEWAVISVGDEVVYSNRRGGFVIAVVKRLLMKLLRQYHVELEARQTRFNISLLAHVLELERRVERLERADKP